MTLLELSADYRAAAVPLQKRLKQLRQLVAACDDAEELWHLKRRIAELTPILTQMNELADLTAHYYERGYYRSEKYTL
jgi:hypothetical protein